MLITISKNKKQKTHVTMEALFFQLSDSRTGGPRGGDGEPGGGAPTGVAEQPPPPRGRVQEGGDLCVPRHHRLQADQACTTALLCVLRFILLSLRSQSCSWSKLDLQMYTDNTTYLFYPTDRRTK